MKRYIVHGWTYANTHTVVEASSPEEAVEIAQDRVMNSPCHQCAGGGDNEVEWILPYEYDVVDNIVDVVEVEE